MSSTLTDLSRYVYGTTRLGDESIPLEDRKAVAKKAIDSGLWIHTSHQYGSALNVLREVFDEDRQNVPNAIFKIGHSTAEEVRGQVNQQLGVLGMESMAIGQVCPSGELADQLATGGQKSKV